MELERTKKDIYGRFSLMQTLAIIYIFGLLSGCTMPSGSNIKKAEADVRAIETNLIRYKSKTAQFPTTKQGLSALVKHPVLPPKPKRWIKLMNAGGLIDPWGMPYQYVYPGIKNPSGYDIFSMGPDLKAGTKDDIGNW